MRKFVVLCAALLLCAAFAAAQDTHTTSANLAASSPSSPASPQLGSSMREPANWKVSLNYEFTQLRPKAGKGMNMNGFNTTVVRYVSNWFGVEGSVGGGLGHMLGGGNSFLPPAPGINMTLKTLFTGGGLHVSNRNAETFQPFVHVLVGNTHFRFTQLAGQPNSYNAFSMVGGGGVDIRMSHRFGWHIEGDYYGTRVFSVFQHNFGLKTGLVFFF